MPKPKGKLGTKRNAKWNETCGKRFFLERVVESKEWKDLWMSRAIDTLFVGQRVGFKRTIVNDTWQTEQYEKDNNKREYTSGEKTTMNYISISVERIPELVE